MHLHRRKVRDTVVLITLLMGINVVAHFSNLHPWVVIPAGAVVLVALARGTGLTWGDLGVRRSSIGQGLAYGGMAAVLVIAVAVTGVALPLTRELFLNDAYASMRTALLAALIIIPLTTVLPEELIFRGVLHGSLQRFGVKTAFIGGSILFCLWHVATSLSLACGHISESDSGQRRFISSPGYRCMWEMDGRVTGGGGNLLGRGGFHLVATSHGFRPGTCSVALGAQRCRGSRGGHSVSILITFLHIHLGGHAFTIDEMPVILRDHRCEQLIHRGQGVGGGRGDDDILLVP